MKVQCTACWKYLLSLDRSQQLRRMYGLSTLSELIGAQKRPLLAVVCDQKSLPKDPTITLSGGINFLANGFVDFTGRRHAPRSAAKGGFMRRFGKRTIQSGSDTSLDTFHQQVRAAFIACTQAMPDELAGQQVVPPEPVNKRQPTAYTVSATPPAALTMRHVACPSSLRWLSLVFSF